MDREQTSFTNGPWRVERGTNGFCETWQVTHVSTFKAKIIADCGAVQLVNHNNPNDIRLAEDNKANAYLIASAPELLQAAVIALETIKHAALSEFNIPQEYLEKAIAKAKGAL